jgi:FdhE protein
MLDNAGICHFGEDKQLMKAPMTDQDILAALREQRDKNPGLSQVIDLHMEIIAARSEIEVQPPTTVPGQKEVGRLLDERVPILHRYELEWDVQAFTALAARVCDIAARHRQELSPHLEEVRGLLFGAPERTMNVVAGYLTEGKVDLPAGPNETQELLSFVLIHALHPFLHAYAVALTPIMKDEQWYQRLCLVCGGEPDLGYLEKEVGGLRLLCSRCDTVWTYKRGECTFCGNSNNETFAYYLGDNEVYRLYLCDNCKRYLKVLDGRQISLEPVLPLQRIITIGMDISARQEGYR